MPFLPYYCAYVTGGGSFPKPLSPQEEAEYLKRYKAGDPEARAVLIEHNLRLVAHIAKKYAGFPRDSEDLISTGTIGLIKGITSFNEGKGTRLATYLSRCIENEILMYFRADRKNRGTVYINEPLESESGDGALTLDDVLADDFCLDEDVEQKADARQLRLLVDTLLDGRERQIIRLRYGFAGQDPLSQQQVAGLLGISRSYVSRLEKKAVEKLRRAMQ